MLTDLACLPDHKPPIFIMLAVLTSAVSTARGFYPRKMLQDTVTGTSSSPSALVCGSPKSMQVQVSTILAMYNISCIKWFPSLGTCHTHPSAPTGLSGTLHSMNDFLKTRQLWVFYPTTTLKTFKTPIHSIYDAQICIHWLAFAAAPVTVLLSTSGEPRLYHHRLHGHHLHHWHSHSPQRRLHSVDPLLTPRHSFLNPWYHGLGVCHLPQQQHHPRPHHPRQPCPAGLQIHLCAFRSQQ